MAFEESGRKLPHTLRLDERKTLALTGVEDVESFDEAQIVMRTTGGSLIIKGSGLQMDKLSLDTGEVSVSGLVTDLLYEEKAASESLWKRLFH